MSPGHHPESADIAAILFRLRRLKVDRSSVAERCCSPANGTPNLLYFQ